jgi:hypothetical protein
MPCDRASRVRTTNNKKHRSAIIDPQMNTRALRFAPTRDGAQRANTWRTWVQGNECYLAMRDGITLFKVSLHRNFRWQLSGGTMVHRLARLIPRSDGWVLALQLAFLIDDDVLRPVTAAVPDR